MHRKRQNIRRLTAGAALFAALALLGILAPPRSWKGGESGKETEVQRETDAKTAEETQAENRLSQPEDFLPQNIQYGEELPVTDFQDRSGEKRLLSEYEGKALILIFWGSWCPDCDRAFESFPEYEKVLEEYPQARVLLIDRLVSDKGETTEKAQAHLKEKGVSFETWFDPQDRAYQAYGMRQIPSMLALDGEGRLRYMTAQLPQTAGELSGILDYVLEGADAAVLSFLQEKLQGTEGGIRTNYVRKLGSSPSGYDVLSESQGLLMEYALLAENQELFDQAFSFAQEKLQRDGVFAWYVTEEGEQAKANALLDDLRIFKGLVRAEELWGGYAAARDTLAAAILSHNLGKYGLTDFYDFGIKKQGTEIAMYYADFEALEELVPYGEGLKENIAKLEQIVEGAYLGDTFPLYAASYNYKKKTYSQEELNTAEALMTLYHLAKTGRLKEASHQWLLRQLENDALGARYETDGTVAQGYAYDATGVYGLAALIGEELGDRKLFTLALQKMELARVQDKDSALYGSFTRQDDGGDITAFDQLIPMLVYAKEKEVE